MFHIFFIHSLVEGNLGCFQVLAIAYNADINNIQQMSLGMSVYPVRIYPRLILLDLEVD